MAGRAAYDCVMESTCTPSPFNRKRDNSELSDQTPSPPAGPKLRLKWNIDSSCMPMDTTLPSDQTGKPFSSGFWGTTASGSHAAPSEQCFVPFEQEAPMSSEAGDDGALVGCGSQVHPEATTQQEASTSPDGQGYDPLKYQLFWEAFVGHGRPNRDALTQQDEDASQLKVASESVPPMTDEAAEAPAQEMAHSEMKDPGHASVVTEDVAALHMQNAEQDLDSTHHIIAEEAAVMCTNNSGEEGLQPSCDIGASSAPSDLAAVFPLMQNNKHDEAVQAACDSSHIIADLPLELQPSLQTHSTKEVDDELAVANSAVEVDHSEEVSVAEQLANNASSAHQHSIEEEVSTTHVTDHDEHKCVPPICLPGCDTMEAQLDAYTWTAAEAADEVHLANILSSKIMVWLKPLVEQHIIINKAEIKLEALRPIRELLCMEPMSPAGILKGVARQADPDDFPSTSPKVDCGHWLLGCKVETRPKHCGSFTISAREFHTGKAGAPKMLGSMTFTSNSEPSWLPLVFTMALRGVMKMMWQPDFHVQPGLVKLTINAIKEALKAMSSL